MTRQLIQTVEIDQPFCNNTYGTAPCTAAVGVTGTDRCFNTYATCQDLTHYNPGIKTLKFCTSLENAPRNDNFFPALLSVDMVPTQLNIGNSDPSSGPLGRRAKVAIKMRDFPYHDRLVDKYWNLRSYDPMSQGTFWTKWLARNPYHLNYKVRVKFGDLNDNPSTWQTREYILYALGGPSRGEVSLVAKDVLKLTDSDQAVCPAPSTGVLYGAISNSDTSLRLYPAGVGSSYATSGWLRIGSECVSYTRSGDICTIGRGQLNTTAASANAGDLVQQVAHLNARVDSVVYSLCTSYAQIPTSYITFTDWQTEANAWLSGRVVNAYITEPTGVGKLLGELMEQCALNIWWDERNRQIRFKAIRPLLSTDVVPLLTDELNVLKDSLNQIEKTEQRITEVWFYYNLRDPTQSQDSTSNYHNLNIKIDTLAESTNQYGGGYLNEVAQIKQVKCRWFDASNASEVIGASSRILQRFRDPPVWSEISVDYADSTNIWVGDVIDLKHYNIVDFYGATKQGRYQVIGATDIVPGHTVKYTLIPFVFAGRISFVCQNDYPAYASATTNQRAGGCWITNNNGTMPDGSSGYQIS